MALLYFQHLYLQPINFILVSACFKIFECLLCIYFEVIEVISQWYYHIRIVPSGHLKYCVHCSGTYKQVCFFACSMAECIESHSIWVCPDSRYFCSIISMFEWADIVCNNLDAKNWFLFWPEQQSEYKITCLIFDGKELRWIIAHVPISDAPLRPWVSFQIQHVPLESANEYMVRL